MTNQPTLFCECWGAAASDKKFPPNISSSCRTGRWRGCPSELGLGTTWNPPVVSDGPQNHEERVSDTTTPAPTETQTLAADRPANPRLITLTLIGILGVIVGGILLLAAANTHGDDVFEDPSASTLGQVAALTVWGQALIDLGVISILLSITVVAVRNVIETTKR